MFDMCYEVLSEQEIQAVLANCRICDLAVAENNQPYAVPMYYEWYCQNGTMMFRLLSKDVGMKMNCMEANSQVALLITYTCTHSVQSIVVLGTVQIQPNYGPDDHNCNEVTLLVTATSVTGREYQTAPRK